MMKQTVLMAALSAAAFLVAPVSAQMGSSRTQCRAEYAACDADATCSTCYHRGQRCSAPDGNNSAWDAELDYTMGCGDTFIEFDYSGLRLNGSMPPYGRTGTPGELQPPTTVGMMPDCEHPAACLCRQCVAMRAQTAPPQLSLPCTAGDDGQVYGYSNEAKLCWSNNECRALHACSHVVNAVDEHNGRYQALSQCNDEVFDCLDDEACFLAFRDGQWDGPRAPGQMYAYAGSSCESNALCDAYVRCVTIAGWGPGQPTGIVPPPPPDTSGSPHAAGDVRAFFVATAGAAAAVLSGL